MLAFERPFLLVLLLVIPLLWWAKRRAGRRGLRLPLRAWKGPAFEGRPFLPRACRFLAGFLFWLGFASLVVAAAGPARVSRRGRPPEERAGRRRPPRRAHGHRG